MARTKIPTRPQVMDERFTGYGMIQPGAHPEYNSSDHPTYPAPISLGTRIANTFRNMVGGDHPDLSGIEAEIAQRHAQVQAIRGAKVLKQRTGV